MSKLRFRISMSLDGFVAGPNQSVKDPLGIGGMRLHEWVFPLEIFRKMHGMEGGIVNEHTAVVEIVRRHRRHDHGAQHVRRPPRHRETQEEIDDCWAKLSADPQAEQCGWLKDKYGVSWQIVPAVMFEMQKSKDRKKLARVTEAFLQMKKFDIAALQRAYDAA